MVGPSLKHGTTIVIDLSDRPLEPASVGVVKVTSIASSRMGWGDP